MTKMRIKLLPHDYLAQIDELLGTDIIKEEENKEN